MTLHSRRRFPILTPQIFDAREDAAVALMQREEIGVLLATAVCWRDAGVV